MHDLLPAPADNQRPAPLASPHLVPLAGEWALWRDIAVRARQIIGEAAGPASTRSLDRVLKAVLPALRCLPDVAAAANDDL
jgi:hypothetical protein